jgi:hypothetical protein
LSRNIPKEEYFDLARKHAQGTVLSRPASVRTSLECYFSVMKEVLAVAILESNGNQKRKGEEWNKLSQKLIP